MDQVIGCSVSINSIMRRVLEGIFHVQEKPKTEKKVNK
jgi:hypothetical protein